MRLTDAEQRAVNLPHGGDAVVLGGLVRRLLAEIEWLHNQFNDEAKHHFDERAAAQKQCRDLIIAHTRLKAKIEGMRKRKEGESA